MRERLRPEIRRRFQERMQENMRRKRERTGSKGPRGMMFGGGPAPHGGAMHLIPGKKNPARKTVEVKTDDGKTFTIEVSPKNEHPEGRVHVFVDRDEHGEHGHAQARKHVRKNTTFHVEKQRDATRGGRFGGHPRPHDGRRQKIAQRLVRPHDGRRDKVAQRLDRLMKELDRLKKELRELRREL